MEKSPDAFRTISEVADHLDTPAHVLRFWESRFPQIRPVKRAGGRRYYRPSDVALLAGIRRLLHDEGLTIRGVQKILREQGVRHVAGLTEEEIAADEAMPATPPLPRRKVGPASEPIPFPVPVSPPVAATPVPSPQPAAQLALSLDAPKAPQSPDILAPDILTPDILTRLRALPPGALVHQATALAPLAARLRALADRLADAARDPQH